jgi:hypothetical protein
MHRAHRHAFTCVALAATISARAFAQPAPDPAERRGLVDAAIAARDAGQHADALALFEQAGRIQMRPGLRLSVAREALALGRGIEACEASANCVTEALADPNGVGNASALEGCQAMLPTVCASVTRIQLRWPSTRGLHVRVGGRDVDASGDGALVAVAPGLVVVQARSDAGAVFESRVEARLASFAEVLVHFETSAADLTASAGRLRGPGVGSWILLGTGAFGLGLSALFLGLREEAKSSRDASCGFGSCDPAVLDFQRAAERDNLGMYLSLGIGAAAATAGLLWWVLAPGASESVARSAWNVRVAPIPGGAMLGWAGML